MLNTPRMRRYLLRLLSGYKELEEAASREIIFHPRETGSVRPAIYPDGALEKITGMSPWRNKADDMHLVRGGDTEFEGTFGYVLSQAACMGPSAYSGAFELDFGYGEDSFIVPHEEKEQLDKACLVSTWSGCRWFGCYLLDDYPLELLGGDFGEKVRLSSKTYGDDLGYRDLLGLDQSRILTNARVSELTVLVDGSYNRSKAERYRELRQRLNEKMAGQNLQGGHLVYLKRPAGGEDREMQNEAEVESFLKANGFVVVDPTGLSPLEVSRLVWGARVVISVEGSHKSHVIFSMADEACLLVIQPPDRFAMYYKEFTDCLDMKFGFLVGETAPGGEWRVDIRDLGKLLEDSV